MAADAVQVTLAVADILDSLSVNYVVGGSLASSLQGVPGTTKSRSQNPGPSQAKRRARSARRDEGAYRGVRDRGATPRIEMRRKPGDGRGFEIGSKDVDIVADLAAEHLDPLVRALQPAFYIDRDAASEAIRTHGSFNVIHLATMFKVDVFVLGDESAFRRQMTRRQSFVVDDRANRSLYVTSAEDVILAKLHRYSPGGEVTDRQCNDVLGVLKVQGSNLDMDYLETSSRDMGLQQLLQRAFGDAGMERTP